jgi:YVTN family beta-propeller protein
VVGHFSPSSNLRETRVGRRWVRNGSAIAVSVFVTALAFAPAASAIPLHEAAPKIFSNVCNATASPSSGKIRFTPTVPVPSDPTGLAISPNGGVLYVSCPDEYRIRSIDPTTGAILNADYEFQAGPGVTGLAVSPDGKTLFAAETGGDAFHYFETGNHYGIARFGLGTDSRPAQSVIGPNNDFAWVSNSGGNTVSVVNIATQSVVRSITVDTHPRGIAMNWKGDRVYTANTTNGTVSVIDTGLESGNTHVITTIHIGGLPVGLAISPNGYLVYVTNYTNAVTVIDTGSNTVVGTIDLGRTAIWPTVSADSDTVYVTEENVSTGNGAVAIINALTGEIRAHVPVGDYPFAIVASPKGDKVFAAVQGSTLGGKVAVLLPPGASAPSNQEVNDGDTATFTSTVTNKPDSVHWQLSADGGNNWHNVDGANSATLTFAATKAETGNLYRLAITDATYGNSASEAAELTVDGIASTKGSTIAPNDGSTFGPDPTSTPGVSTTDASSSGGSNPALLIGIGAGIILLLALAGVFTTVLIRGRGPKVP